MLLNTKYLVLVIQSKKTDSNTKTNEIEKKITDHNHNKYITTPEFNKLTSENFAAILKHWLEIKSFIIILNLQHYMMPFYLM